MNFSNNLLKYLANIIIKENMFQLFFLLKNINLFKKEKMTHFLLTTKIIT